MTCHVGSPPTTRARPLTETSSSNEFLRRLNALLVRYRNTAEGRLYQLDLSSLRDALGDRWSKLAERVDTAAESTLRLRLGAGDVYYRQDDIRFLVAVTDRERARAKLKLALIALEIGQRMLGSSWQAHQVRVNQVDLDEKGNFRLTESNLEDSVERVSDRDLAEIAARHQRRLRGLDDADDGDGNDFSQLHYFFRPMWRVKRRVITTYLCLPALTTAHSSFLSGYTVLAKPSDPVQIAELDLFTLNRLEEEFKSLEGHGSAPLLAMSVHFETLVKVASRLRFTKACQAIPEPHRRRLVFELVGLPDGVPGGLLGEMAQALRPLCRAVLARMPRHGIHFQGFRMAGVDGAGIDLGVGGVREENAIRDFDRFVEAANTQRLMTYAHGIPSLSLTTAAVCAGFDFVDGYAIASTADAARDIEYFDIRAPYELKFGRAGAAR